MSDFPGFQSTLVKPRYLAHPLNWAGHIPFAFWLLDVAKPGVILELGTNIGNSYFAFCQSIQEQQLPTKAFAVDTWQGDEHACDYGEEVFSIVHTHNQEHYHTFSTLMRMTFDDATTHFANGSIDLLHIGGFHTYETVKHDFENWLPKMSEHGIVLFHDTNVHERIFGVWRLFSELSDRYPSISFDHSDGLGVLVTGMQHNDTLKRMIEDWKTAERQTFFKSFFSCVADRNIHAFHAMELGHLLQAKNYLFASKSEEIQQMRWHLQESAAREKELSQLTKDLSADIAERTMPSSSLLQAKDSHISSMSEDIYQIHIQLQEGFAREEKLSQQIKVLTDNYNDLVQSTRIKVRIPFLKLFNSIKKRASRDEHRDQKIKNKLPFEFDADMYLKLNPDVKLAGINPILHYNQYGQNEGRKYCDSNDLDKEQERKKADCALNDFFSGRDRISFPEVNEKPKVSILVVLFNQAGLTLLCLKALEAIKNVEYEIIIVDNASNDQVPRLLTRIDGARILRNQNNEGFIRAVNSGAEFARGEYLLLLNNDALLFHDTLLNAVNYLDNNYSAGALGGKILLWNNQLQEAGSIIWKDGSCRGYGRDDDPNKFEYNFTRKVDYCSGAFFMTRTHLFKELGGFDTDYCPAYYDETDYCVRLWKSGYTVIYNPSVKIRHFEFGSMGDNVEQAFKLQEKNRAIFVDKHKDFLAGQLAPDNDNILDARMRIVEGKKRILFIDDRVPYQTLGSGYPRAQAFIKSIEKSGHFITLLPLQFPEPEFTMEPQNPLPDSIEVAYGIGCSGLKQFLLTRELNYDFIIVSRPHNIKEVDKILQFHPEILNRSKIIYDAEALFCLREITKADVLGNPLSTGVQEKMIADELSLYRYAHKIVTVSEREGRYFRKPEFLQINVIAHTLEKLHIPAKSFDERFGFLFVGAIQSDDSPNGDSLIWFINNVWPLITTKIKNAQLNIVGLCESPAVSALASANVIIHGRRNTILHFYEYARVFIAPTRFSAGIPCKVHEAGAYGLPVISTPIIASQLGWEGIILTGGSPQEFAHHCITLHESRDLWTSQQTSIFKQIKHDCNPELFHKTVESLLT